MNINSVLPLAGKAQDAGSSSKSSNATAPSNELNANSFMTLLTAQLQAQDPLNPLDPKDMMNELVSLNTLQELIRIREDLEGGTGSGSGSSNSGASGATVRAQSNFVAPSTSYHDAVMQSRIFPAQSPASN